MVLKAGARRSMFNAYLALAKHKLDKLFAADIVGDGTGDEIGPFQQSQNRFWKGQVILLCERMVWRDKQGLREDYTTLSEGCSV